MPMRSILTSRTRSSANSKALGHCPIRPFSISLNPEGKELPIRSKLRVFSFVFNRMWSVSWKRSLWSILRTIFESSKLIYSISIRTFSIPIKRCIHNRPSRYRRSPRSIRCSFPQYRSPFWTPSMIDRHVVLYSLSWVVSQHSPRF